jgi:hypothetical protein
LNSRPVSGNFARGAELRLHKRVYDNVRQLRIRSGDRVARTSNWSQSGFLANGLSDYGANDRIEGTMQKPGGAWVKFSGKVVRAPEDGTRAVQLVKFDSTSLLTLQSG